MNVSPPAFDARPHRRGRARQILLNTLSSYLRDVVDILTFLVLTPFLIRVLGKESFGLWSLVWSVVSLFALADLGVGTSVVKYVADARGRGDLDRLRRVVSTTFWIYAAQGAALLLLVALLTWRFNAVLDIPQGQHGAARAILLLLGLRSALCLPLGLFRGVLNGSQRLRVANLYKVAASIGYFGAVLLVLSRVRDLRALAVLNLLAGVLPMAAMAVHARLTLPGVTVHPRYFDRSLVREMTGFSLYFFLIQVSTLIYTRVDSIVIKVFLPLEAVAVYTIAIRLTDKAGQFCNQLVKALTPVLAELHGAGETANVKAAWRRGAKLSVAFATPLLLGLALLARPLITAWTGPGFEEAVPACRWLAAAAMVAVIHANTNNLLSMVGHHRYLAFVMLGSQVANLLLSIALIGPLGIQGVAMATFLVQVPMSVLLLQTRAGRLYGYGHLDFYRETVLPALLPAAVMAAIVLGLERLLPWSNLATVAGLEALGVAVFGGCYWLLGLDARERSYFQERLRPGRRRQPVAEA